MTTEDVLASGEVTDMVHVTDAASSRLKGMKRDPRVQVSSSVVRILLFDNNVFIYLFVCCSD